MLVGIKTNSMKQDSKPEADLNNNATLIKMLSLSYVLVELKRLD